MPVVHIYMYAGRTKEQKNELVKRISKDFEEVVNVKSESLNILFHDTDKENWGIRGDTSESRIYRQQRAGEPAPRKLQGFHPQGHRVHHRAGSRLANLFV